jgi:hypothetical protein
MKRPTQKPQDRDSHVPLEETLKWIADGEKLQAQWNRRKGPAAERMAESMHKRLEKLRAEAEKLWKLHLAEKAEKAKATKKKKK